MGTITLARQGIDIDGQPFFLLAGQVHYFRYPRGEWRDLLLKARAGGLNTIDTVIPWNRHEPAPGRYDFTDEADLPAFLDLCAAVGLYVIVRPGPYICAEWENGGYPAWLTGLRGVALRVDNPIVLEHLARWFDTLFAILAPRQATRGGPIILSQIENEHWASGRYGHDGHQRTLARMALERGMDVPQYTCMGAMRGFAEFRNGWSGIAEKLQQTRARWPDNPMIVSELWSGWFDHWGESRHNHKTATRLDVTLHQLAAVGASGWSHWMWAGGTNFGYWGGRTVGGDAVFMTTSYDYDAPVSEYGELTDKFYVARRHHLFLATLGRPLADVLADAVPGGPTVIAPAAVAGRGEAGSAPYRSVAAGASAPPGWAGFGAAFLQNLSSEGQVHQVFHRDPPAHLAVPVEAMSIRPVFANLPLQLAAPETHLSRRTPPAVWLLVYHTTRILGFWQRPAGDLLVLYGSEGERGEARFNVQPAAFQVAETTPSNCALRAQNSELLLQFWITAHPTVVRLDAGGRPFTVVLLTTARAERWWPVEGGFICGPDLALEDRGATNIDRRGVRPFFHISDNGQVEPLEASVGQLSPASPHVIWASAHFVWETLPIAEAADPDGWMPLGRPQPLEELGCDLGYGWYRAVFELDAPAETTLAAPWLADRARVLLDGRDVGWLGVDPGGPRYTLPVALAAGRHDLRLLLDNLGRFNYGANTGERKGLLDTLYLGGAQHDLTDGWAALWQEAVFAGEAIAGAHPAFVRPDAEDVSLANFPFQGPIVWLLRSFAARAGLAYVLHLTGDRNPGALFVNGVNVTRFSRHYGGGFIKADITPLARDGENVLALQISGYAGAAWRAALLEYDPARALPAAWSFRAGVRVQETGITGGNLLPTPRSLNPAPRSPPPGPAFHRTRFDYDPAVHGPGPFRLRLPGMRKGQIWLNGRNIGRYWHVGPQECYKLPASWLQAENELLLFDEEGGDPGGVEIGG